MPNEGTPEAGAAQPQPGAAQPGITGVAGTPAQETQGMDKYHGQSREQVIQAFETQGQEHDRLKATHAQYEQALRQVMGLGLIKIDESGAIMPDDDAMMKHLKGVGVIPNAEDVQRRQQVAGNGDQTQPPKPDTEGFMDRFQDKPLDAISEATKQQISPMEDRIKSLTNEVYALKGQDWVRQLDGKYQDFDKYKMKAYQYIKKNQIPINSMQDMEQVYIVLKHAEGGYVPIEQHEAHVSELNKTMAQLNPSGNIPNQVYNPDDISEAELIGKDSLSGESAGIADALLGGSTFDPIGDKPH